MANVGSDEVTKIRDEGTFRPEGQKKWLECLWEELRLLEVWAGVIAVAAVCSAGCIKQLRIYCV